METQNSHASEYEEMRAKTRLEYDWMIWENWKGDTDKGESGYLSNMQSVAEFGNLIDFWRIWRIIPHADPGSFFVDPETFRQFQYHLS